ncbi:tetratricopeptide repeat protein [Streptomyces sp. NPDC052236]|uniref:tetratricopeptide repeat protein n=1 Tax=Streptomyces sp. NPDC052236 TaxID=3365686 RepID=UPI0037D71D86
MAQARRSAQQLMNDRRRAGFVGRRDELAVFRENLDVPPEDEGHRFIFHIHGNAGVGKSSLVRELVRTARERRALTALIDESVNSVPEAMAAISAQFAQQGHTLKALDRLLATYRQRRYEAEVLTTAPPPDAQPQAQQPSAGSMAVAQAGLIGLGTVPIVGALAGAVDPAQVARGADHVRALLSAHFGKQEDVQLVLDPLKALTPVLMAELHRVAADVPWITLFFDTYERTSPFLDTWLRDLITSDRYGELPAEVVATMAGQGTLDTNCWADNIDFVTDLPLVPFTEAEARQLLAAKRVVGEDVVQAVLRLSGGLPVLVSTLAASLAGNAESANGADADSVDDPSATAVERFLKWERDPVRRSAALEGALPRRLNEDIFQAAVEGDAAGLFGWLRSLPFVSDRGGRAQYHDVVREPMLRLQRNSSPQRWRAAHTRLAHSFGRWREAAGDGLEPGEAWAEDAWRELKVEETYHLLCAQPRTALAAVLRDGTDACDAGGVAPRRWAQAVADAGGDSDSEPLRAFGRDCLAALEDEQLRATAALGLILARPELPDEGRVAALVVRARDHRNTGQYKDALRDYGRAISLDGRCRRAYYGRGETYRLMGRWLDAVAEFDRALGIDPVDTWSLSSRALTRHALGQNAEALADLDRALELKPGHVWSLVRRSQVRRALADTEGALEDIGRAEAIEPENPWIVGERGEILRHDGRYEEAIAQFDRAFALDPAYAWALGSRAMAKQALGRTEDALADLGRAVELTPDYVWALIRRAEIHRARGDSDLEFADLDRAVESARFDGWALAQRAYAHQLAERYEEAIADYDRALALDPDYGYARVSRGRAYERLGRYEEALADLDLALEPDPDQPFALSVRAGVRRVLGDLDGELADLDRAVTVTPDSAVHLMLRGEAHRRAERYEQAIADYDRAAVLTPGDGWVFGSRGQALRGLGRYEEALTDLAHAAELQPDKAWIAAERGAACQDLGRYEEALTELDRAIALDPAYGWAYGRRAAVHVVMGSLPRAQADLDRFEELGGNGPAEHRTREVANVGLRPQEALATLERAAQSNAEYLAVLTILDRMGFVETVSDVLEAVPDREVGSDVRRGLVRSALTVSRAGGLAGARELWEAAGEGVPAACALGDWARADALLDELLGGAPSWAELADLLDVLTELAQCPDADTAELDTRTRRLAAAKDALASAQFRQGL